MSRRQAWWMGLAGAACIGLASGWYLPMPWSFLAAMPLSASWAFLWSTIAVHTPRPLQLDGSHERID